MPVMNMKLYKDNNKYYDLKNIDIKNDEDIIEFDIDGVKNILDLKDFGCVFSRENDEFKFKTKRNPIDCQTGRSASGPIHVVNPGATMFASKKAIHSFGLLHQAVHGVFIGDFEKGDGTTEEKILLSRRGEQKVQWPGYWDITVGEHMEESAVAPLDALKNAVNKELGITLEKRIARFTIRDTINYKTKTKTGEIIDKTDDEFRHVFVIRTDKLNNNNEIEPKDKGDT